ncbi:exonuclease domain-containing protein [Flexivirga oryzae]|uniref:DNA polymerase-3 subunit epsilon n=1 Tax=Flexivirga oryzae TaxID=1794944 RepID=A0A839N642_9MICO|nr:exonuclease domain-containing protein [Flexivirga oryzae]MBB2890665.1 DNA polymerase-3 subunit epsilon [Flexivirga oryzae]
MSSPGVLPREVAEAFPFSYAVVDVETTGLSPDNDRVLQIAVTQLTADGALEKQWTTLVDPERDPGPVHIHGITAARLRGAPRYADVADHIHELINGRVFVAHNARFDWDFLSSEADRAAAHFPSHQRLCTWQTSAMFDLPLPNLKLGTICQYWGVSQARPHDAADDVRALVEVTRHSLAYASFLHLQLPISRPWPRNGYPPTAPRANCPWKYPGRHTTGESLRQGMTVVFTGPTAVDRTLLIEEATEAGLAVMNSVSSRTSLLVSNGTTTTRKAERARLHGTSILTEAQYRRLLSAIQPGVAKQSPTTPPAAPTVKRTPKPTPNRGGPLAGHRVIIIGGAPDEAHSTRDRIVESGGACAVNLTASVTAAVPLSGHQTDQRWARVQDSNLLVLDQRSLQPVEQGHQSTVVHSLTTGTPMVTESEVAELPRGGVTDVEDAPLIVTVRWSHSAAIGDVDVVAFVLGDDELVGDDDDFCFYNQREHPGGAVDLELDTIGQAVANIRPSALEATSRVMLAASIDGDGVFGQLGAIELDVRSLDGVSLIHATLDAADQEASMLLAAVYWRNGSPRFRAIGQGYQHRLETLAVNFGVDIEDSPTRV